jgi:hypothetical protein
MIVLFLAAAPLVQQGGPLPSILEALRLPTLATEARNAGVAEAGVRELLYLLRPRLRADEAALIVRAEVEAVQAGAPKGHFGEFVQQQLETRLRGRELEQALRAEHRARGVGRQDSTGPRVRRS